MERAYLRPCAAIVVAGLLALGGCTPHAVLGGGPLPSIAPTSTATPSGATTISVGPGGVTQALSAANGIAPTVTIAAGASSTAFSISAVTSTMPPSGTPNLSALGVASGAVYVTLTSASGPAALNSDLKITVPTSAGLTAIFIPDGKSGNLTTRRAGAHRVADTPPSSTTPQVLGVTTASGNSTVVVGFGTYTGTLVFAPGPNVPSGCYGIANVGEGCIGNAHGVALSVTVDNLTNTNALGTVTMSCTDGSLSLLSSSASVLGGNVTYLLLFSGTEGSDSKIVCDVNAPVEDPAIFFDATFNVSLNLEASLSQSIAFYHPTDTLGTTPTVSWPSKPGVGPMQAIPAEIQSNTQSFVYAADNAAPSGTITIAPTSSNSSAFCSSETYKFSSFTSTPTVNNNVTSFAYPADALGIQITDSNASSNVGACNYTFSDGIDTATLPILINPISVGPSSAFNGSLYQDVVPNGGGFTLLVNQAAYEAANLLVPMSLTLDTTDEMFVNPNAGISYNGTPGVYSCATALGAPLSLTQAGLFAYVLTFPASSSTTYEGTICEVYIKDGVIGVPIDIWFDLNT